MFTSSKSSFFLAAGTFTLMAGVIAALFSPVTSVTIRGVASPASSMAATETQAVEARSVRGDLGEFGADLSLLRRYHVAPDSGESNHYIDLWSGNGLPVLARVNHLTNNHALFVDSHGKAGCGRANGGYGFFPNSTMLQPGEPTPYYSAGDLARVLGPEASAGIHNIVLAGCNVEGRFRSSELRRHFLNATNITYMTPGELAFKPMYYQAIVLPAAEVRCLYGKTQRANDGRLESRICTKPAPNTRALGVYVADLYLPSAKKPYGTVRAGRELLEDIRASQGGPTIHPAGDRAKANAEPAASSSNSSLPLLSPTPGLAREGGERRERDE